MSSKTKINKILPYGDFLSITKVFFFVIIKSAEGQSGLLIKKSNKKNSWHELYTCQHVGGVYI